MTTTRMKTWIAALAAQLLVATAAGAQGYPDKPIKLVLPFAAGGQTDVVARIITKHMTEELGQQFVIENIPGAGGSIAAANVARATPDGYTLLYANASTLTILPTLYSKPGFDPVKSFTPIGTTIRFFFILAANPSVPANNLRELIAYAKANPGKLNYGSPGQGTTPHLIAEELKQTTGINVVGIAYKGAGPATRALLAGETQLMFDAPVLLMPLFKAGKLKPLVVTRPNRMADLPDVQTTKEAGFPGLEFFTWSAMMAPAGTPDAAVRRLSRAVENALKAPEVTKLLAQRGFEVFGGGPKRVSELIRTETPRWAALIHKLGLKVQ